MLADLLASDHDLVQGEELNERVAEEDEGAEDPVVDLADEADALLDARAGQADGQSEWKEMGSTGLFNFS